MNRNAPSPRRRPPQIRYRCPTDCGAPTPGSIIIGDGPRIRRAYRVLSAILADADRQAGISTWRILVEPMSVATGRMEIATGCPRWIFTRDRRTDHRRIPDRHQNHVREAA